MAERIENENEDFISGVWSERVLVVTQDYEIKGYVFMYSIILKAYFVYFHCSPP